MKDRPWNYMSGGCVWANLCQDESLDMLFMRERTEASFEAKCIGGLWTSDGTFGIGAPLTTMEAVFFVGGLKWRTPPQ